jgi:hypothetical protein
MVMDSVAILCDLDIGHLYVDSCENVHVSLKGERSWRHSLVKTAQIENDTMLIDCLGDVYYKSEREVLEPFLVNP